MVWNAATAEAARFSLMSRPGFCWHSFNSMDPEATPEPGSLTMWRSMFKVMAATAAFGAVHSVLASSTAKRAAARVIGERNCNGLYRVFYIGQSLVTFGMLAAYIRRQPIPEVYRVEGPLALLMHAVQAGALVYATSAAGQVGIRRITGLENFLAWLGDGSVPPEPEAQGPALDEEGLTHDAGPFAWSRHPLNFAPLPIFWLWPRMTTNLLAFNTAATIYLVVGSLHEEARLRQAFGDGYDAYLYSGVPFYIPAPEWSGLELTSAVADMEGVSQ
jgi:hypothetical protein